MLADTGTYNLCNNESTQAQLHLPFVEKRIGQLANGTRGEYDFVSPVILKFSNRKALCNALVLGGYNEPY